MKTGAWDHPWYGPFDITEVHFDDFIRNFTNKVRGVELALDVEHFPELGAVGWFKDVFKKPADENNGPTLWATVEWTEEGAGLVKSKKFRYFSPEFDFEFTDPETKAKYSNVLYGGGLTNARKISVDTLRSHIDLAIKFANEIEQDE
jgi:hypothetical protein